MAFFGEYNLQLDDKSRMRIPAKLRAQIAGNFYILNGTGGCLFVMTEEKFNKYVEKFASVPVSDFVAQNAIRRITSSVVQPDEDNQGRFVLPAKAKEYARIDKRVVFIGVNDRMEIWSEEVYNEKKFNEATTFDEAISALSGYGI